MAKDFILVQQFTDDDNDLKAREIWDKYGGKAVPFYVILDANGAFVEELVPDASLSNVAAEKFAAFLQRGKAGGHVSK